MKCDSDNYKLRKIVQS